MNETTLKKVIQLVLLVFALVFLSALSYYLINLASSTDDPVEIPSDVSVSGGCGNEPNVQFEHEAVTSWISGSQVTALGLEVPVSQFHINCFTEVGTEVVDGAVIQLTGPGYSQTFSTPSPRNINLSNAGTYTASCVLNGTTCDSDTFTLSSAPTTTQCPSGTSVLFRKGTETTWVAGSVITSNSFSAPVTDMGVRCIDGNSILIDGATVSMTGPGYSNTFDTANPLNISLSQNGTYSASCIVGGQTCSTGSFTLGSSNTTTTTTSPTTTSATTSTNDTLPETAIGESSIWLVFAIFVLGFGVFLYRSKSVIQDY